jgi:serine/threonine protein phosphatase 1
MRTIAVGDIHGCRRSLEALEDYAGFTERDTIVTLGDYADRGPDTRGVIDYLQELGERMTVISLMGNHEVMMLEARKSTSALLFWMHPGVGGEATLQSYGAVSFDDLPAAHWSFITGLKMYHETETHLFVHAGLEPQAALEEQSEHTLLWERFDRPAPHRSGKVMICGHTSQRSGLPVNLGHAICIDTWACGEGWLTALDVGSGRYWQTNERGQRRCDEIAARLQMEEE